MTIATTLDKELAFASLKRLGVLGFFEEVFICEDYETNKSEPMIFYKAAKRMNVVEEYDKVIVFEDSSCAIETAKKAGFWVVPIDKNGFTYIEININA